VAVTLPHFARRGLAALQIVAALVLVALVLLLVAGTAPSVMGYESFVVYSGSMEPAIRTGDIAVVGPAQATDLKVGDVVTYRTPADPDVVITHRIMDITTGDDGHLNFQTKGDANNVQDQVLVDQKALLGRVAYAIPRLGYLVDFSKRTEGKLLFIALPGLLLAADYLRERLRRREGSRRGQSSATGTAATPGLAPEAATRLQGLLASGRRALEAGYPQLAAQAADGALELDARNEDAWLLKAQASGDPAAGAALLQTALVLNPGSQRVSAALHALQLAKEHAAA
jgi:signal peptidase I